MTGLTLGTIIAVLVFSLLSLLLGYRYWEDGKSDKIAYLFAITLAVVSTAVFMVLYGDSANSGVLAVFATLMTGFLVSLYSDLKYRHVRDVFLRLLVLANIPLVVYSVTKLTSISTMVFLMMLLIVLWGFAFKTIGGSDVRAMFLGAFLVYPFFEGNGVLLALALMLAQALLFVIVGSVKNRSLKQGLKTRIPMVPSILGSFLVSVLILTIF